MGWVEIGLDSLHSFPFSINQQPPSKVARGRKITKMGKDYNVCFRKVTDKKETHFVEIGVGFISTDGKGRIDIVPDSIPVNWDGRITLFPLNAHTKEMKNG